MRAPRDRAWIADGYVSDRWLPVSPVTGAVDAFEWKAPVDAIGRGDDTLLIEERVVRRAAARAARRRPAPIAPERVERDGRCEPTKDSRRRGQSAAGARAAGPSAEPKPKPAIFVPERPPDDPGVAQAETDEKPDLARAPARGANPLKPADGQAGALLAPCRYCH